LGDPGRSEQRRLETVYGRYAASGRLARAWSASNPGNRAIRAELVEAVLAHSGDLQGASGAIADIGCGAGWWLEALAERGIEPSRLHGADLLPDRVEAARARVPDAHLVVADAGSLPWQPDGFILATLFTVLSSMRSPADQTRAIAEAVRVLRPGGHLLIWEPRIANPRNRQTTLVRLSTLRRALGPDIEVRALTLLPLLARRLGRLSGLYPVLARAAPLRSHRLVHFRKPE
jgi:ubiquinone/menaquinone biosynthesis C-methylase UbiE